MIWEDGSRLYLEQVSHHPPISTYYMLNSNYKYSGFYNYSSHASLNSGRVINDGKRKLLFNDGLSVTFNFNTVK